MDLNDLLPKRSSGSSPVSQCCSIGMVSDTNLTSTEEMYKFMQTIQDKFFTKLDQIMFHINLMYSYMSVLQETQVEA